MTKNQKSREQLLEQSRLAIKQWAGKADDEWLIEHLDELADQIETVFSADLLEVTSKMEFSKGKSFAAIERKYGKKNR